jgi:hypothetical protein
MLLNPEGLALHVVTLFRPVVRVVVVVQPTG